MLIATAEPALHPVSAQADRAFRQIDFAPAAPVIVAVSGGSDSTALLHLFCDWLGRERPDVPLIAATVDHGLRPESAEEGAQVAAACAESGIPHHTLRWTGERPSTGVQDAARRARYHLLTDLARREGARLVLTGHTADDQAETVAMRKARAPEGLGVAGIDRATLSERTVWFVRPLLDLTRIDLRGWLSEKHIGWIDDPSNADPHFERVRVRAGLTDADRIALIGQARSTTRDRTHRARLGAGCLDDRALWRVDGEALTFDPGRAKAHGRDALLAAMAAALAWTGCLERQPDIERADAALDFAMSAPNGAALTTAGCLLRKRNGRVAFAREARNRRDVSQRCFDVLLPSADWPLADALARLHAAPPLPAPPFTTSLTNPAQ